MLLRRNEKGEFEEVRYANPTPEMLILSKLDELKEELDIVSSKLLITEAIPKEQYENRLKADMVAILEETQAQIDDLWEATWHSDYRGGFKDGCIESNNIIQQKINSLKEAKDGENNY